MNAIQILHNDHQQFIKYFDQIEAITDNNEELNRLFKALEDIITAHMKSEEDIFYIEAMKVDELRTMIEKSYQSHHLVNVGLIELHLVPYAFDSWKPKFRAIRDSILQHMQEEEHWLFPKMTEHLSEKSLDEIGNKILQLRQAA